MCAISTVIHLISQSHKFTQHTNGFKVRPKSKIYNTQLLLMSTHEHTLISHVMEAQQ